MLKRALILVGVAAATVALAVTLVQGARGRGVAANTVGQRGHFRMDVRKATNGTVVEIGGDFLWEGVDMRTDSRIRLYMRRAHAFTKDGHIARFAGRAVFSITRNGVTHHIEGGVHVTAADNRNPTAPNPANTPDALAFHFATPTSNMTYAFEGLVREGDIQVYQREL